MVDIRETLIEKGSKNGDKKRDYYLKVLEF